MKKLVLTIAVVLFGLVVNAQSFKVISPTTVVGEWDDIKIREKDSKYDLIFANDKYKHIYDPAILPLRKIQHIKKFGNVLNQLIENPNPEILVNYAGTYCRIRKNPAIREGGDVYFTLYVGNANEFITLEEAKSIVKLIDSL